MGAWQASFVLGKLQFMDCEAVLGDFFEAVVIKPIRDNDPTSPEEVSLVFPERPDEEFLRAQLQNIFDSCDIPMPELKIEALPDIDWLQHVYETLKPIDAGRFFVHGSHIKDNIPDDKIKILIEAASAFGTGEHPTTNGCLMMLDKMLDTHPPKRVLDMGCGSGILAIAVAKIVPQTDIILGIDIHKPSIDVANAHARDNDVDARVQFVAGDGFRDQNVKDNAPYDMVLANILAQPLMDMAPDLAAVAQSGANVIMSGFTVQQRPYVSKPYLELGFKVMGEHIIDEWVSLWLQKN